MAGEEFLAAYASEALASRLFNAGLAYEKAGDTLKASECFGRYLDAEPNGDKAVESRARKAALDQLIAEKSAADAQAAQDARDQEAATEQATEARNSLDAGDYQAAAARFEAAYQVAKDSSYLFEKAEALRLGGKLSAALTSYRQYSAQAPEGLNLADATRRIQELEAELSSSSAGADLSSDTAPKPESGGGTSTLRIAGLVTAGVGISSLGISVFLALEARNIEKQIESLDGSQGDVWTEDQNRLLVDGDATASNARALAITGGALLVGGALMYFLGAEKGREKSSLSLAPTLDTQSTGFAVQGWF